VKDAGPGARDGARPLVVKRLAHSVLMRLWRSRRAVTADTPLEGAQEMRPRQVSELSTREIQASIDRALRIMDARRVAGGRRELELQVVVQACPAGLHYPRWRKERNRVMARSSKRWGTGAWPEQLPSGHVAIVVLPYAAGRVGPALAAAKIVYPPAFLDGRAETRAAVELLAMQAVRRWLHMTGDEDTLVLAPPVLEEFQQARVQRRSLLDCGASSWPLPPPDGL
jgi:hypothetical protein